MRWFRFGFLLLSFCVTAIAHAQQQDAGNAGDVNLGQGGNITSSGSGGTPQDIGSGGGGRSENINASEFGERGTVNEAEGFIGANVNAQQGGFVGQNQAFAGANNTQGGFRGGQFGNIGGAGGRGGFGGGFGGQLQRRAPRQIRTRLVLPADVAANFRTVPAERLQTSLGKLYRDIDKAQSKSKVAIGASRVFATSDINITANGRTVTLLGQVSSARERKLAERIAGLEPGVDRVVNQLTIVEASR